MLLSQNSQNTWLWDHTIKFARWQHPAIGCGRDLLDLAAIADILFCI